jgi:hypothetical protein
MPECNICSCDFIGRADAKTCSSRCRQILWRMKRTPIETNVILDLTDKAAMAKLDKVLDTMRDCDDPDPYSENSVELKDQLLDTLREIAINNPKNHQPDKYQRKAKSLK